MRTIKVSISDLEYNKFGFKETSFSFSDLVDLLTRELSKQRLDDSLKFAKKFGLSKMSMADITKEVNAARKDAKNRT